MGKNVVIGVLLSFIVVPTALIARLAMIGTKYPPISERIYAVYPLYGSVSVALFLIVGIPVLWFLRSKRWESLTAFCLGGVSVSIIGEALLIIGGVGYWDITDTHRLTGETIILSLCGLICGAAFWAITKRLIRERT